MKTTKQNGLEDRKAKQKMQPRPRASADETVFIQITDEQGKEQVRVPFSRRFYAALQSACVHLDCTMQQLFLVAVSTELTKREAARTPAAQPKPLAAVKPEVAA